MDILIILGLVMLNGVFAMSELSIVSSKRVRLETLSKNGSRGARAALELADNPSRFLSTVQVGITLIGIFTGAFGEASLVTQLMPHVSSIPALAPYAREISLVIIVMGITYASIVLGELVPKRIAMQYPEAVATLIAPMMRGLSLAVAPFVKILSVTTDAIMRLLRLQVARENRLTEEEIAGLIKEGAHAGIIEQTEHDIVARALRLDDQRLGGLMTPRNDLEFLDLDAPLATTLARIADSRFTRFPVFKGKRNNVVGLLHCGDLFEQAIRANTLSGINLERALKPVHYVPESISAMDLLEVLKKDKMELALVVDEYGEIEGMVTLNDLMAALVGDVSLMDDGIEADANQREDGSWLMDGGVSLDRFRELMQTETRFPGEASGSFHTLAGFVLNHFGRLPQASDYFVWDRFRIEVVDMDRQRIDRLLVSVVEPLPPGAQR